MSDDMAQTGEALQMLKRLAAWTVLVGLVVAVLYLLSERNQRTFAVEQQGQELRVMRGRMFPFGRQPYDPADRGLARAYAPLMLRGGDTTGELLLSSYADRDELDRALFKTLRTWIESRIESDNPERLSQAMDLLSRAELLTGIGDEQRRQLKDLQARIAYFEGRVRLDDAVANLRESVNKLKLAAETQSRYSRDAGELYERVSTLSDQLARAVRQPLSSARLPETAATPMVAAGAKVDAAAVPADRPEGASAPGAIKAGQPLPAPAADGGAAADGGP